LAWRIEFEAAALKELSKLDHAAQRDIRRFLRERLATDEDPMRFGDPLRKNLTGLWKYRVGAYRLICAIQGERLVVLVVRVGHRREVYDI
jgi:mRNA interferase RelE/StbE